MLNGIPDAGTTQPDFLDRVIKLNPRPISDVQRLAESVFWARFEEMRPRVLGALFTAVSMALRRKEEAQLNLTGVRFVDFVRWTTAAAPAWGFEEEEFIEAYQRNRGERDMMALDNAVIYPALIYTLQFIVSHKIENVTMAALFEKVTDAKLALSGGNFIDRQENWPRNAAVFGVALRRIAPVLRKTRVSIRFKRVKGVNLIDLDASDYFGKPEKQALKRKKEANPKTIQKASEKSIHCPTPNLPPCRTLKRAF